MEINNRCKAEKDRLRREFSQIRAGIPKDKRAALGAQIQARLLNMPQYAQSGAVFTYVSKGDEVGTRGLIAAAWAQGKRAAAPRCLNKKGEMAFFWITAWEDLEPGRFGVLEPKRACPKAAPPADAICIVPALSFDPAGYRLGYGGGYYDRFLAGFPGFSIGLCFAECMARRLPRDSFDRPVDAVATEKAVFKRLEA